LRDDTIEQGDIVVNEQKAKALSQPRVDAQGRPIKQDTRNARPGTAPAATPPAADTSSDATTEAPDPKRSIRSVGPTYIPVR
jgi:hypothetical protein